MTVLPESGQLSETSLPRLLMELHAAHFEGALRLSRAPAEKSFLFHKGVPVYAESNLASESLGAQLVQAGSISRSDHERVVERVKRESCKEGRALLELQLIDPRSLFLALKEHVRLRLVDCFGWPQGAFELDTEASAPEASQPLRLDVYALVQEGIETHWSPERVLTDLGPHMAHYPTRTRGLPRVASRLVLDPAVETLLAALDGEHTLWQLLGGAQTPRALAAAWVIDASGAIEYAETPVSPEAGAPAPEIEIVVGEAKRSGRRRKAEEAPKEAERKARAEAAANLAREIHEYFERLDSLDYYQLLGVDRTESPAHIKRAYLAAARSYHPDVISRSGLDADTRVRANKVFSEIGRAYATLSDPEKRLQYDDVLAGGGDADFDAERLATAESMYRKGDVLLRQGNFRGSLEFLRAAVELWPDEANYQRDLGWALYKKAPSEPERALEHLEAAVDLDAADAVAHFRLSLVLRSLGQAERGDEALARARQLDPGL